MNIFCSVSRSHSALFTCFVAECLAWFWRRSLFPRFRRCLELLRRRSAPSASLRSSRNVPQWWTPSTQNSGETSALRTALTVLVLWRFEYSRSELCAQDPSAPIPHRPVWTAGRRQRPGRRALHRHRGDAGLPDGVLAAGVRREEGARSHRRRCRESKDPSGPVASQTLHCLPRKGRFTPEDNVYHMLPSPAVHCQFFIWL